MKEVFCDDCKEKLTDEDFKAKMFRGGNIVFEMKVIGLGQDYCMKCIEKARYIAKRII